MTATRTPRLHGHARRAMVIARIGQLILAALATIALLVLIAGVPVALWRLLGWPLPHRWPTIARAKSALSAPFTDRTLLDVLACLCWVCWVWFVIDVVRVVPGAIQRRGAPSYLAPSAGRVGPMRTVTAVLIGAIVTGLLAPRLSVPASGGAHAAAGIEESASITGMPSTAPDNARAVDSVTVREPRDGIYDSLWRIAQRTLGDGERWLEIFRLNVGRPQRDGASLTSPSLIRPGWILLLPHSTPVKPTTPNPPTPSPHREPTPPPIDTPTSPPTATPTARPTTPSPRADTGANDRPHEHSGPATAADHGIDIGDGVYLSLGLAAAVSGALAVARRRNRRRYIPGSGRREDLLPVAPVIRSLHLAHLRETVASIGVDGGDDSDAEDHARDRALTTRTAPVTVDPPPAARTVDLRTVDATHGLGLVGPGAAAAARALLLDVLATNNTTGPERADVLLPSADTVNLLGPTAAAMASAGIRVVDNLASALDQIDAALLHRARLRNDSDDDIEVDRSNDPFAPIVLITRPPTHTARLQAVLDTGASLGLVAIVLGQWRSGTSCYLEGDGTITAISDPNAQHLRGARTYTATASVALDLLAVLHDQTAGLLAHGEPPASPDVMPPPGKMEATRHAAKPDTLPHTAPEPTDAIPAKLTTAPAVPTPAPAPAADLASVSGAHRGDQAGPPQPASITLTLFGTPHLHWTSPHGDVVDLAPALGKRQRELLVLLALHRDGLERARLADTLWPDSPPDRPFNALHTTLSRMRRSLAAATADALTDLVATSGERYLLNRDVFEVDYWTFDLALAARRTASTAEQRAEACRRIVACYHGELAAGMDADWIDTVREAARRDALDAATELARAVVDSDPQQALNLLETACEFDPLNEQIYCSIMRTQRRLGRGDAIKRTMSLLTARLAEIGEAPARETLLLAETLQRRPTSEHAASQSVGR